MMSRLRGRVFPLLLLVSMLEGPQLFGDTLSNWNGGTGNWGTASNWTPPAVPNNSAAAQYAVTIGPGGPDQVTIDLGLNPIVDSLVLGGSSGTSSLQFAAPVPRSANLSVLGDMTVNATGSVNFGGFLGFGSGPFNGSLSVGGTLTNAGAFSIYPGSLSAANVVNNGSMVALAEPGIGTVSVPGTFTNHGSLQLGVTGINGPGAPATTIGQLVNTGGVTISGAGTGYTTLKSVLNEGVIAITEPTSVPQFGYTIGGLNVGTGTPENGYNQFSDGVLDEVIGGLQNIGRINVGGAVSLSGTLDIMLQNGFVIPEGDSFNILSFTPGELTGTFDQVMGDPTTVVHYDNAAGEVYITSSVPEPSSLVLAALGLAVWGVLRKVQDKSRPRVQP